MELTKKTEVRHVGYTLELDLDEYALIEMAMYYAVIPDTLGATNSEKVSDLRARLIAQTRKT